MNFGAALGSTTRSRLLNLQDDLDKEVKKQERQRTIQAYLTAEGDLEMEVSSFQWGSPIAGWLKQWKNASSMDENWGYPCFRKPHIFLSTFTFTSKQLYIRREYVRLVVIIVRMIAAVVTTITAIIVPEKTTNNRSIPVVPHKAVAEVSK